jgi:MFS transporter, putative metabolite transport protein
MTGMQWAHLDTGCGRKFFEGLVVFMTGVAMPLIADEFKITAMQHGVIGAAILFDILIGAVGLGSLSDHFGRKRMFVVEMLSSWFSCVFSLLSQIQAQTPSLPSVKYPLSLCPL